MQICNKQGMAMKELEVENNNNFYNMLFLYKSGFYKNVLFKTEEDDYQFNGMVEALNKKNKKERIKYIYDFSCEMIDKYNDGKNICGFKNNICRYHQEIGCKIQNGCCKLCSYQSSKGCITANLSCKLFYCKAVIKNCNVLKYKDLKILKLLSFRRRIIARYEFFSTREQILQDLYLGSLLIYSARMIGRVMKVVLKIRSLNKEKIQD